MRFSIGITIHNEARNIRQLLGLLRDERLENCGLERVVVVSSASSDGSDDIVRAFAAEWPRLSLVVEERRNGKAAAINLFLRRAGEVPVVVLLSGDVQPAPGSIARLLTALEDPKVGMAAGRPVPTGFPKRLIDHIVRLQWELHHEVSLVSPKLGEVVAFRTGFGDVPSDTAVDEAAIEALLEARGFRLEYVPEAVIHNKGPESIADFLRQRRRISAGHRHLAATQSYRVATTRTTLVLPVVLRYLLAHPLRLPVAVIAAMLEGWGRVLGFIDLELRGRNPYIWDVATSTKELGPVTAIPAREERR